MASQYAVRTEKLTKLYGQVGAVIDLDLAVPASTIFGLLGPNGAGKTTTIRMLMDLIRPTSGRAEMLGLNCQEQSVALKRRIGYLAGELHLYDNLTGRQHVDFVSQVRGIDATSPDVQEVAGTLELDLSRHVGAYSRGNKQKLGLLLALIGNPKLLLLDEPTTGMDPIIQERVLELLRIHAASGGTVFFSSHNLSEVQRLCQMVGIMRGGRLIDVESVESLRRRSFQMVEVRFPGPIHVSDFHASGIQLRWFEHCTATFEVRENIDALVKALSGYRIIDMRMRDFGLEDLFFAYYEGDAATGREVRL